MGDLGRGEKVAIDGKIHADASKSHAVSYGRLLQLEQHLQVEVKELIALGEWADRKDLPGGLKVKFERLLNLARARAVPEAQVQEWHEAEKAEYEAKMREREEKAKQTVTDTVARSVVIVNF